VTLARKQQDASLNSYAKSIDEAKRTKTSEGSFSGKEKGKRGKRGVKGAKKASPSCKIKAPIPYSVWDKSDKSTHGKIGGEILGGCPLGGGGKGKRGSRPDRCSPQKGGGGGGDHSI